MDIFHADAQLVVAALSDAQLLRAFGHTDRTRAVAELAQARRAEAAAPSPDDLREAEARQLQAVLAAVAGRHERRSRLLRRTFGGVAILWCLLMAGAVSLALMEHYLPEVPPFLFAVETRMLGGAAVAVGFCLLMLAAVIRVAAVWGTARWQRVVLTAALEWATRKPGRLERGLDGLPTSASLSTGDARMHYATAVIIAMVGGLVATTLMTAGHPVLAIAGIIAVALPLIIAAVMLVIGFHRLSRRTDAALDLSAALTHPSPQARARIDLERGRINAATFASLQQARRNDSVSGDSLS
ncbi:hypothetical protein [Brevibacterium otitidis]|uniref:ABC transmembrane type-1 domain-containing protein n=1 Tax=Brevibacterium otitidis TaxID=53364 RepID=A0ABV5X007_9MICO|nr:hypothetical protein GCM10023233_25750 [Brevibacterium otitidis]